MIILVKGDGASRACLYLEGRVYKGCTWGGFGGGKGEGQGGPQGVWPPRLGAWGWHLPSWGWGGGRGLTQKRQIK